MRRRPSRSERSLCIALLGALCLGFAEHPLERHVREAAFYDEDTPEGSSQVRRPTSGDTDLREGSSTGSAMQRASYAALERGLAYLAQQQQLRQDGSLPQDGQQAVPIATAALASLAWMAGGSGIERGPHGRSVERAIDYLLRHVDLGDTSPRRGYVSAPNANGKMHAHGFATLALAESFATSPRTTRGRRTFEALVAAVRLIERTQGVEGGWWYDPQLVTDHENSITICLVQALRAAHNCGIEVETRVIARAVDYVKRTQNDDGSFRYGLNHDLATVGITAAAISTLNATGEYAGSAIAGGVEWIWRELDRRREGQTPHRFPHYERLYLAQALWQNPDTRLFERWYEQELPAMLTAQNPDGSWVDGTYGDCYATAMNCLVLALPMGFLPIFQR